MTSIKDALKRMKLALENLHFMHCDVWTMKKETEKLFGTTTQKVVLLYKEQKCRLDWTSNYREGITDKGSPIPEIKKTAILYSDLTIPAKSIIEVYIMENGIKQIIGEFIAKTPSQYFVSHTETIVELYERYIKHAPN